MKPAYTKSDYFHFEVEHEGEPLKLRLRYNPKYDTVEISEIEKQKWEEYLWEGELYKEGNGEWVWGEEDNFFIQFGGQDLADRIAAYVNENGVPKAEVAKVASVPDDLWELWTRLRDLTDEPEAVRKLWLLAQQEIGALPK